MSDSQFPVLRQTVIDCPDPRRLAEFYRELLGLRYSPGDEPGGDTDRSAAAAGEAVGWVGLDDAEGRRILAFQLVVDLPRPVWPDGNPPQMMHLDTMVRDRDELTRQRARAEALGATVVRDEFEGYEEPLYVFTDPAGHPFCIFVAPASEFA
jgi:catechol 2,3-dioxygenase-like lactoylglutathione lyase family enzyme